MMEQSKKSSLMVARSILNNKLISKKLERYLKVRQGLLARFLGEVFALGRPDRFFAPQPRGSALLSASSPLPQGENPFTDSPEEEKEQEEGEGGALEEGALVEAAGGAEGAEGAPAQPPVPPEPAPVNASPPPPPPPPEEDEEAVPLLGGALERQIRGIPGLDVEADDEEEEGGGGAP